MRLKRQFQVLIQGDTNDVLRRENVQPALGALVAQLLMGVEVSAEHLRPWGITITRVE